MGKNEEGLCRIVKPISSSVLYVSYGLMVLKFICEYLSWVLGSSAAHSGLKIEQKVQ